MSIETGPVKQNNLISAENLEKDSPASFNILQTLARLNDNSQKTYATMLAQNLVYELRDDPDSPHPEELEALVGYLVQFRFKNVVGLNPTLVLENPDFFTHIFLQAIFEELDFIIDTTEPDETAALREMLLDITEDNNAEANNAEVNNAEANNAEANNAEANNAEANNAEANNAEANNAEGNNKEEAIKKLKVLFTTAFAKPRIIATLLPFYRDFLLLQRELTDSDAKKKAFIELIAVPFIEGKLVELMAEADESEESENLAEVLQDLRENHGLYDAMIVQLDKALPLYKSPKFSVETLSKLEKQYVVSKNYLNFEKNTQKLIADWREYYNTFDMHSPCRRVFSDLVTDLQEELAYTDEKIIAEYRSVEEVSKCINDSQEAVLGLVTPHQKLKEHLDPFRVRTQELAKVFKQLAQDFPPKSDRYTNYQDLSIDVLRILANLEIKIAKGKLEDEKYLQSIENAEKELSEFISAQLDLVVAGLTPLQRLADQLGKTTTPEQRKKLETSLLRLEIEGADASATTPQYRARASSTILKDVAFNLATLRNPFQASSRSASEIAAMRGARPEVIKKLAPPPSVLKSSSWSLSRFSPKNLLSRAGNYLAMPRLFSLVTKLTASLPLGKSQTIPPLLAAQPETAGSQSPQTDPLFLMASHAETAGISKAATASQPPVVSFGKGHRLVALATPSLASTQNEAESRRTLTAH